MERREFIAAVGAVAAAVSASSAFAEEAGGAVRHMHPPKYKGTLRCRGQMRVGRQ